MSVTDPVDPEATFARRGQTVPFVDFYPSNRPWRMLLPPIYRYLPSRYVDQFFSTGVLRLSSIATFRAHKDEARGDTEEGASKVILRGSDRTFAATIYHSEAAYILCGSFILSPSIMRAFDGCDSAIEITNVADFGLEIARHLPGFQRGLSGYCIYSQGSLLMRDIPEKPFPLPSEEQLTEQVLREAAAKAAQEERFFLKAPKFAAQAEYRLIFAMDDPPSGPLVLHAPRARDFCRKVGPAELTFDPR